VADRPAVELNFTAGIKTLEKNPQFHAFCTNQPSSTAPNLVSTIILSKMARLTIRKQGRKAPSRPKPFEVQILENASLEKTIAYQNCQQSKKSGQIQLSKRKWKKTTKSMSQPLLKSRTSPRRPIHYTSLSLSAKLPSLGTLTFSNLAEFSYVEFEMHNIRKLHAVATKGGFEFESDSSTAMISAKGIRVMDNIVIAIENGLSWKKVEKGVERWMLSNKKEITVKVAVVYRKTGLPDSDDDDDDGPPRKKVIILFSR